MKFYIVRISVEGEYQRFPTVYFTKEAAQKICDWNNKMYSGFYKVMEEKNED